MSQATLPRRLRRWAPGLFAALAAVGCGAEPPPPPEAPRPVTVVQLETIDPVRPLQISGSVRSWTEQSVAFEVAGPVDFIVRETTNLEGRWLDEDTVIDKGQLLARLRDREFVIARDSAQANLNVAEQDLELARTQLKNLLPARLRAAEANQVRAQAEYERFVQARKTNAVAEIDVIRHKADLDQRTAETEEAQAEIDSKRVEITSLEAQADQANEALAQAQYDLDRCTLWSPFSSEVSEVFIEAGGYAHVGESVAHLVMMDPIKVDVSVSAARSATLRVGDPVKLYPLNGDPMYGWVYEKATAADSETRTFRVSVMARNARFIADLATDSSLRDLPRIETFNRPHRLDMADADGPLVVEEREALRQDDQGIFVWATDELPLGQRLDPASPVLDLRKVRVVPGDERRNFQGIFVARALDDPGPLDRAWIVAHNVPDDFQGGRVLVAIRDWQLRPGQIVPTLLGGQAPKSGLYLPIRALAAAKEGQGVVFVVVEGVARRVPVRVVDVVAELVKVEVVDDADAALLQDGSRVIVDFVHFLQDGEPVRVVETRELMP